MSLADTGDEEKVSAVASQQKVITSAGVWEAAISAANIATMRVLSRPTISITRVDTDWHPATKAAPTSVPRTSPGSVEDAGAARARERRELETTLFGAPQSRGRYERRRQGK